MTHTPLFFSDTTLRDGEQMPGASLTGEEKLTVAQALAELRVDSLDAGFPARGQDEIDSIRAIVRNTGGIVISALCRALPSDIDAAREALEEAPLARSAVSIFLATSPIHRERKLCKSKAELIDLAASSIRYARRHFHRVAFSPEDASRTEVDFLAEIYRAAIDAGATNLGFTDTLGILTPESTRRYLSGLRDAIPALAQLPMAVHFHDDLGLATANTLAAVQEGAIIVQGTINGIGERAGNVAIEEVALAVFLHADQYRRSIHLDLTRLRAVSRLVSELTSAAVAPNKAVVGRNLFLTEAGIHQDGLLKDPETYLPFPPEVLGETGFRLVLGKHSGKAAIGSRLEELGIHLTDSEIDEVARLGRAATREEWRDDRSLLERLVARARQGAAAASSNLHVHYSAQLYDSYTRDFVHAYDDLILDALAAHRECFAEGGDLVDVGTGTARLLVRIVQDPRFDALHLIGVDYFADMLDCARAAIAEAALGRRIEVVEADAHALPFESGSIQVILSRSTLHHWADPATALREIYRCLAPGGVAIIHDVRRDPNPEVYAEFNRLRAQAGVEPSRLEEKLSLDQVSAIIESSGLADVATLSAASSGIGALGFEVRLVKEPLGAATHA